MREEQKGPGSQREEEAGSQNEHQEPLADEPRKAANPERPASFDPLLRLRGSGPGIWGNEDPVEYVRRLRED